MYSLYGPAHCFKSIYKLAHPHIKAVNGVKAVNREIRTSRDLKDPFVRFLNHLQPAFPVSAGAERLVAAFSGSQINDLQQEQMISRLAQGSDLAAGQKRVEDALRHIRNLRTDLYELFHLAIQNIILADSATNDAGLKAFGGSTNRCIGLIWFNLKSEFTLNDVIELCIHELTHTLVFIDELNTPYFHYSEMTKRQNWAHSAILKRSRPMDKVVHSVLVATEIILARQKILGSGPSRSGAHPSSEELKKSTLVAIESVLGHPNFKQICTDRVKQVVEEARDRILL